MGGSGKLAEIGGLWLAPVARRAAEETAFFVRTGNSTRELDAAEKAKYILGRWPGGGNTH